MTSDEASAPTPVLVELFTSEGCSSCPPADALLERLDREQPVPGALLVVLSEHVDYWNELGWKDPFSLPFFSERQQRYAARLKTRGPYTPQMVVDGQHEFVGSDAREVQRAARTSLAQPKVSLKFGSYRIDNGEVVAQLQTGNLAASPAGRKAEVVVTLARNRAASSVTRGENEGRYMPHVAVANKLTAVATIAAGGKFVGEVRLPVPADFQPDQWRLVAFLQEAGQGPVIGATAHRLDVAK